MSYCINPHCPKPFDLANAHHRICRNCGSELILKNRYRVVKQLGQGGFGNTFEIDDSGETKVLKVLTENNTKAVELFQQEAKVLTQLQSAGIPRVDQDGYFTFFPRNSQVPLHCLVMEKISGVDLEQWMDSRDYQPITQTQALDWLKQLVEILALVHGYQYFHRDIKPQNIMLRPSGQLVLIDFGAVRQITTTILEGNSHTRIISQGYSPPEQQNGYSVQQSDFFALGRTFIFLLTGKQPQDQAIYDPLNNELHWRKYAVNLSVLLADLIDHLTAPTANQRPENTQVILQRLKAIEKSLNKPHTSINTTKSQSNHSSLPTVSIGLSKSNNATGQLTQNWVKYWQWSIGLGVGCLAIATFLKPYHQNTVIPQEKIPGFSPSISNTSPVIPITQPTPNTQPKITQIPVNVTASQEIEIQKRAAALKAEQQIQAAIAAQKKLDEQRREKERQAAKLAEQKKRAAMGEQQPQKAVIQPEKAKPGSQKSRQTTNVPTPKKPQLPPPPQIERRKQQNAGSGHHHHVVDVNKPWESTHPIPRASDKLEQVIRGGN
ncbi:protein kinase [Anabaenopsis sp. FSS-46]|uniref:protein kinase domain-containing protein n=1 Tax=Anabaenopsis sp. FSS-46 TaxID=2971766 RepID=UPI002473ABC9|nr:protein kinase [Anabaenopsis sp. FSS-46]MDH6098665.1 protein kinase [Anabaenopsis sp. FSS-46]